MALLLPLPARSQQVMSGEGPAGLLNMLGSQPSAGRFIKFSYVSPYGVTNLSDAGLLYQQPAGRGRIVMEGFWTGIPGFYQFGAGMGYVLKAWQGIEGGVFINAALLPAFNSQPPGIRPSSAVLLVIEVIPALELHVFADQWAGYWISANSSSYSPRLSVGFRAAIPDDFEITGGLSYPGGGIPLMRLGLSVHAGKGHTVMAGIQTGPAGCWTGYRFESGGVEFVFYVSAGGIFGMEPGSSVKYTFK